MADGYSRRERQIMNILHRLKRGTAADIQAELDDAPSYSAIRAHLASLEKKGHIRHEQDQLRYVYLPVAPAAQTRKSALQQLVDTFFSGSPVDAAAALLDPHSAKLRSEDLDRLQALIDQARREGR